MTIDLVTVGKTDSPAVAELVAEYSKRISRWARFAVVMLPDVKRTGKTLASAVMKAEGEMLLKQFAPDDLVVLLDDKGAVHTSMEFAQWLGRRLAGVSGFSGGSGSPGFSRGGPGASGTSFKRICFVVGGAYGFSPEVYKRANDSLSLSRMTFSHQIVRAIFAEQLYRAFSILHGEPYHHE